MKYCLELQKTIDNLNLKKEDILYLNTENQYLDEMRTGVKDVEYKCPQQLGLSYKVYNLIVKFVRCEWK